MVMTSSKLKTILSSGYVYLEFTKKNGELRKMWCTRDNKIIKQSGHSEIKFHHPEIANRERRLPHLIYVYDLQEGDTRIVNVKTLKEERLKRFKLLGEVEIPSIETRFKKKEKDAVTHVEKEVEDKMKNLDLDDVFL